MRYRVLVTCPQLQRTIDQYRDIFSRHDIEIEAPPLVQQMSESDLLQIIDGFDGVIAGDDPFTSQVLEKGTRLKAIAKWGIGVDAIDLDAARRFGIRVSNTPDVFSDEVADVVMGYIILLARQLHRLDRSVRDGGWLKVPGISLRGRTLGVVGVGSIGREVTLRAAAAGMVPVGHDISPPPQDFLHRTGIRMLALDHLLAESDFISLNCSLTDRNRRMIGRRQFGIAKAGVYIVNTARGALIDETALAAALREGRVAGAALDVFEKEPLPLDSPLREFDNCIFGTHNSSNTVEAVQRVNRLAIDNLLEQLGVPT